MIIAILKAIARWVILVVLVCAGIHWLLLPWRAA